jgi:pimeloyl-ACP methyl ester carboxylesterase
MSARSRLLTAAVVALGLPLSAAAGWAGDEAPSDGGGTGSAAVPVLEWDRCGDDFGGGVPPDGGGPGLKFSCAWAGVPLDYDDPGGTTVKLALKRLEAARPEQKLGTLFVNPGGPGGSGVDVVTFAWALYPQSLLDRFDVVGFDARGIARSTPLVCFESFQQLNRTFGLIPPFPLDETEYRLIDRANGRYTDLCEDRAGDLIDHMSTADVARDLDLLRRAVGDEGLTYAGYSYGSQLGSVYANLFPQNVRALMVDGVLDPVAWTTGRSAADRELPFSTRLNSDMSSTESLEQFVALCEKAGPTLCTLAAQGDPRTIYDATMAALRDGPVRADLGGGAIIEVTYQDLVGQSLNTFSGPHGWENLAFIVSSVAAAAGVAPPVDPPSVPARAAERAATFDGGVAMPQTMEGFSAVSCSDSVNPRGRETWWDVARLRDRDAPYFGSAWTWLSAACADWPGEADDRFTGPWTARTSAPVLVVGNLYDPTTPYSGAQALADLLANSRLLTVEGWGHTAFGNSKCVDAVVADYLLNVKVPAPGSRCAFDVAPFTDAVVPRTARLRDPREAALQEVREIVTGQLPGH